MADIDPIAPETRPFGRAAGEPQLPPEAASDPARSREINERRAQVEKPDLLRRLRSL